MAYQDFKLQILNAAFQLVGTLITQNDDKIEKYKKLSDDYYTKTLKIVQQAERKQNKKETISAFKETTTDLKEQYVAVPEKDLTKEKIESGTACLACSRDHLSTASGALNEALRFAKKDGVNVYEVQSRLGIALDELNNMERIDLHADRVAPLKGIERKLADEASNSSRELRHKITAIKTPEELEEVSAEASRIRTNFMKKIFEISMKDGTVDSLCRNFTGEEKKECIGKLTNILEENKEDEGDEEDESERDKE